MNSRLDWLVLSDYYSIYVTNAPPAELGLLWSGFFFYFRGIICFTTVFGLFCKKPFL